MEMDKLDFELWQKLTKFDFKQIMDECSGECYDSDQKRIYDLLKKESLKKVKLNKEKGEDEDWEKIKIFCRYKYSRSGNDLDDSDGKNKYIRAIYNILWGRLENSGYSWFRTLFISPKYESKKGVLYGGDTANTVQTVLGWETGWCVKKFKEEYNDIGLDNLNVKLQESDYKELFDYYHYIGNFVLVPAYFNAYRGKSSKLHDFFDASLYQLKTEGWDVAYGRVCALKILGKKGMGYEKLHNLLMEEMNLSNGGSELKEKHNQMLKEIIKDLEKCKNSPVSNKLREKIKDHIFEVSKTELYQKEYTRFSKEDFNTYINTMFLWDYTKKQGDEYIIKSLCTKEFIDEREGCEYVIKDEVEEVENRRDKLKESSVRKLYVHNAKYAIERRSYFVVAMLRIALGVNLEGEKYKYTHNDTYFDNWGTWEVSSIYKKIMYEVFLNNDKQRYIYSGYMDVISEIFTVVENTHMDKMAKDFINAILNDVIEKLDEVKCESRQQLYTYLDKTIPVP